MSERCDEPVFILGCAGRCGSTLLQRLILSTGDVFIWGENNGMVSTLCNIEENLSTWDGIIKDQSAAFTKNRNDVWVANLNPQFPDSLMKASRQFLIEYYYPESRDHGFKRWGFKEFRYGAIEADFLLRCFPKARILFLLRHPKELLASNAGTEWYATSGYADGVISQWIRNVGSILKLKDNRIQPLKYEFLTKNHKDSIGIVANHIGINVDKFDLTTLSRQIRGTNIQPTLGADEAKALASPALGPILKQAGYVPS